VTAGQIRAARALLNWSQNDLVKRSGLSLTTVRRMEDAGIGPGKSSADNVGKVQGVLEGAGIIFIASNGNGPGVRMRDRTES
jgi:transcriptional regulator with XRE-family HTH domain